MKTIVLVFLLVVLTGCRTEYEDVSRDVQFSAMIGTTYKTLRQLRLHGVTLHKNYQERIDIYSITELPGFSGPEVVTSSILKAGSILKVRSILKCKNCLSDRLEIVVDILSEKLTPDVQIRLDDLSVLGSNKVRELSPILFMKVGEQ